MGLFSSSRSSSSTTTETKDNRQVLDGGAFGVTDVDRGAVALSAPAVSVTGGGNVQVADARVVELGLDYLRDAEKSGTDRLEMMLGNAGKLAEAGAGMAARSLDQVEVLLAAKARQDNPGALTNTQITMMMIIGGGAMLLFGMRK